MHNAITYTLARSMSVHWDGLINHLLFQNLTTTSLNCGVALNIRYKKNFGTFTSAFALKIKFYIFSLKIRPILYFHKCNLLMILTILLLFFKLFAY